MPSVASTPASQASEPLHEFALLDSPGRQIAFANGTVSGQSKAVAEKQDCDAMTVAGQINKGACFDPVTLMRVGKGFAALPGLAAARVASAVEAAVGLRLVRLPSTAGAVGPELHGNRYDDLKGSCKGLCFVGWLEFRGFRTTGARKR